MYRKKGSMGENNRNLQWARKIWKEVPPSAFAALKEILKQYEFSVVFGDICYFDGKWYVTHVGLLRLAYRKRCQGIEVKLVRNCCSPAEQQWVFQATVFKSNRGRGFVGYGDANPSNTSIVVRGAEMRVAETRAVNRALRKAYGIGICSVEELGSFVGSPHGERQVPKLASRSLNGNGGNGHAHNGNGSRVRDRLCQLIREHKLDAELVKSYAVDFCGTKTLREASREQVEAFVVQLAEQAQKDRNALLCQLNSYQAKAGAA